MLKYLLNKVAARNVCNLIKKRLKQSCFSVKLAKVLREPILKKHLQTIALECSWKASPLLVLGKPMLDGRPHNWAGNTLYCKYGPHEVSFHNIQVIPTCLFYFSQASEEGKSDENYDAFSHPLKFCTFI